MKVGMWLNFLKNFLAAAVFVCFCSPVLAGIDPGDNQPLPDLRWSDGQTQHHLYAVKDKPKVLHFWATWCIPCREELPELVKWRQENPEIEVLALSMDEGIAEVKQFLKQQQLNLPSLLLNAQDNEKLAVPIVPYTIFVTRDNRYAASYFGVAPWQDAAFTQQVRQGLMGK